jgi:benzoyl-CoA reductase/2-hydroxyglutaryl-CoA dehydratase subunit BcrC/BadD/HgdB
MHGTHEYSRLERSLRDDPQSAARAAAAAGQRVVGYVGNDVPAALILAAGALPVRLRGKPDAGTAGADRFVESSFTPELRVIAEQWMSGALDHLHAVVFARRDDSGQRLYYYLCELQRRGLYSGPLPLLFDVAGLTGGGSFEHTLESTRILASQLGASAGSMEAARERVRQREILLRSVIERRLLPAPLAGSEAFALAYAADCDWRASFDETARRWLDSAAPLDAPKRVLLAGDPLPDGQLHVAIEEAGASVILELTESQFFGERTQSDPFAAIAEEFQGRESPALSMRRNPRWLAANAAEHRADAVVVWLSEQNEALPWEIARQMESLRAAGVPALMLARQDWRVTAAALSQVKDFLR